MARSALPTILGFCFLVIFLSGVAYSAPKDLEQRVAALEALVADLQVQLAAERAARVAADQTLQTAINTEVAARTATDQTLQTAINTEVAARTATDQSLETAVATIPATATFTSRVPSTLNNLSLPASGVQVQYTDFPSFGQSPDPSVFSMQPNGTLTILKDGSIVLSVSLRFLVITGDVSSSDADLTIAINGVQRASASAAIGTFGEDTLHITLNWTVQAGDTLTFRASSSNNIAPARMICCNTSILSVAWTGTE
jgi:hypothetical protein